MSFAFRFHVVIHLFTSTQMTTKQQLRLANTTERGLQGFSPHTPLSGVTDQAWAPSGLQSLQIFSRTRASLCSDCPGLARTPPLTHTPFPLTAANIIGSPSGWLVIGAFPWYEVTKQSHPSQMGASKGCRLDDPFGTTGSRFQGGTGSRIHIGWSVYRPDLL